MPSYAVAADKEKIAFLTRVHDPVHARGSAHACKLVYAHGPTRACSPTHAIAPALEFINDTLARPAPTTRVQKCSIQEMKEAAIAGFPHLEVSHALLQHQMEKDLIRSST